MRFYKERKILLIMTLFLISLSFLNANKTNIIYRQEIIKQNYENKVFKEIPEIIKKQIDKVKIVKEVTQSNINRGEKFIATSYDLSIRSCGKRMSSPAYGITANGYNLKGKDWRTARTIAADLNVIPLNSKVQLTFINPKYKIYNGYYIVRDRGAGISNHHIDFYMEDTGDTRVSRKAIEFGVTECYVKILN